jgi:hypothetical protein
MGTFEITALVVLGVIALGVLINIRDIVRYIHISNM